MNSKTPTAFARYGLLALVNFLACLCAARAQGTMLTLQTGGGSPLVTQSVDLPPIPPTGDQSVLNFQIGFTTMEVFGPGQIFDSVTLSVQNAALTQTAVLVTLDASGATWAPVTAGGLVIPAASLLPIPSAWGGPIPTHPITYVYDVAYILAEPLREQPLHLTLSLFDNLGPSQSTGYFRTTLVPEPATALLLIVSGLPLALLLRCRQRAFCRSNVDRK